MSKMGANPPNRSFHCGTDVFIPGVCVTLLEQTLRFARNGGAYRDRTDDLMLAKQPLSQLS